MAHKPWHGKRAAMFFLLSMLFFSCVFLRACNKNFVCFFCRSLSLPENHQKRFARRTTKKLSVYGKYKWVSHRINVARIVHSVLVSHSMYHSKMATAKHFNIRLIRSTVASARANTHTNKAFRLLTHTSCNSSC